ncbi:hypothetical protein, variant [Sphaeroforma arctica JP610]|uniref:Uncharacterized protein n=1 Tax=Sphaeroforma arctica JP610 TaxID=667725 RepID=A0A0L0FTQ6_9EUKA|nr:hypothetical protein, variant [Sphaeroforma arctica JP610]KNC80205.1 hypothetical protein, variant [Sphaeroforma arctica JP610]|eukprot:XP_014154107.1 hypothetical protein, variant [Sphaeroforma arctica JP610]
MLDYLRDQLVSTTDTPASSTEHSAPQTEKNPEKLSLSDSSSDRAQTTETPQLSDTSPEKDCSCETPQLSDVCQTRLTPELSDLRQSDMSMSPESAQQGTAGDCLTAVKSGRKATDHDRHHAEHGSTDLHSPVDMQKTSNTTLDTESMGAAYVYAKPASAHEPSHTDSNQRVDTNGMLSRTYSVSSMADVKATPQPTPTVKSKVGRSQARTPAYAPTPQRSSAQTPISHANTSDSGVKLAGNTKTSANRVTDPRNGPQGTPMCTPTPTRALQTPPSSVYPHTNTHTRTYTHTGTGIGTGTFVHPTPSNSSLVLDSGIMVGPKTLKRHNDDNSSTQKRHRNESSFKFASPLKNRPGDTRTSPSASTTDSKAHASTRTRTECSTDADPSTSVGARETRMEASLESGRDNQPTNGMHMNMDLLLQAARLSGARDEACAPHTSTHTYRLETCVGHAHNTLAQRDGKDKATRGVKMAGDTNTRAGDALAPGSCYEVGALTGVGGGGCREGSTREEEVVTGDGWQAPRSSSAETGTVATGEKAHRKAPAATDTVTPDDTGSSINRTERESIDRMEKEKSTETGTSTQSRCTSMADNETRMDDNGTGIAKSGTSAPDSDTTAASSNLLLVSLPNAVGSSRGRPHSPGEREKTNRKRSKNRTASQELSRERAKKDALLHVKTTDTSRSRSRSRSPGIVTKWSGTSQGYATSNEETECRSKNTFITQPIKTKTSKHHRTLTVSSHRSKGSLSGLDTEQICDIYEPSVDEVAEAALLGDMPSLDGPMDAQSKRYLDLANQLDMNREIRQRRAVADSTNRPGMQPVESAPQEVRDLYTQHTKQRDDLTRRQTHERERFSAYTYNEVTTYASELPDGCHLSLASVLLKSKLNTSSRHMSVVGQLAQSICPELPAGTYQARDATTLSVSVKGLFEEAECIRGRQQSEWTALDALQRRQWRYKWSTQPQNLAVNGTLDQSEASMELSRTNQTEACKLTRTFPGAVVQVPGISISDCVLSVMMADQSDLLR